MAKFRALEDRIVPGIGRDVAADEVFEVPDDTPEQKAYVKALAAQPYFEDITPAKRPVKDKD